MKAGTIDDYPLTLRVVVQNPQYRHVVGFVEHFPVPDNVTYERVAVGFLMPLVKVGTNDQSNLGGHESPPKEESLEYVSLSRRLRLNQRPL